MPATLAAERAVLGLPENATLVDARRAFRRLAKCTHPDKGGDGAVFATVVDAFDALRPVLPADRPRPTPYDWTLRPAPELAARPAVRPRPRRSFATVLADHLAGYAPRVS